MIASFQLSATYLIGKIKKNVWYIFDIREYTSAFATQLCWLETLLQAIKWTQLNSNWENGHKFISDNCLFTVP